MKKTFLLVIVTLAVIQSVKAQWVTSGSYLYTTNNSVGIGVAAPAVKLEVVADSAKTSAGIFRGDGTPILLNVFASSNTALHHPGIGFGRSRGTYASKLNVVAGDRIGITAAGQWLNGAFQTSAAVEFYAGAAVSDTYYPANIRFLTTGSTGTVRAERMRIMEDGNVGIGVTAPVAKLDILGTIKIADTSQGLGKVLTSDANGLASWKLPAYSYNTTTNNIALGTGALATITTGTYNVGIGYNAASYNTSGNNNVALGRGAGDMNYTGSGNVFIGYYSSAYADGYQNSTALGYNAQITASNQIRIGSSAVTSIGGYVGWSNLSDGRFKKNVKEDVSGLAFIKQLRPVSYTFDREAFDQFYKSPSGKLKADPDSKLSVIDGTQTGFIAQEVEAVVKNGKFQFSGVVAPQNAKDHYSIRYSEFVVPLVKSVQELSTKIAEQQAMIDLLTAKLGETTASTAGRFAQGTLVLSQNAPNPFTAETEIKMSVPDAVHSAIIVVYNLQGTQLKSIVVTGRGDTSVKISGGDLGAGMYLYTLIADGTVVDTKRMILMK